MDLKLQTITLLLILRVRRFSRVWIMIGSQSVERIASNHELLMF